MQWAVETWGRIGPIQFGVPTKQQRMDEVDSIESSLADGSHIQPELLEAVPMDPRLVIYRHLTLLILRHLNNPILFNSNFEGKKS